MATIREVAQLAGVSPATVSRVMNGTAKVDEEKRKRVEAAIRETCFMPNKLARALFKNSSGLIGLIVPNIDNPFFNEIAKAIEEEASESSSFTLRKILGGDILTAQIIRRQIWLVILIVFFVIIYISNRYNIQNDIIELDKLQKELQDTKYKALSTSSQITEKSRESNVLDMLKNNKDSVLHIATQPPYIINVPEE